MSANGFRARAGAIVRRKIKILNFVILILKNKMKSQKSKWTSLPNQMATHIASFLENKSAAMFAIRGRNSQRLELKLYNEMSFQIKHTTQHTTMYMNHAAVHSGQKMLDVTVGHGGQLSIGFRLCLCV